MKKLLVLLMILLPATVFAGDRVIYQTHPGTTLRDFSQPTMILDGNTLYKAAEGTTELKDLGNPAGVVDHNGWTTIGGGSREGGSQERGNDE